jgi:hypothetical protein
MFSVAAVVALEAVLSSAAVVAVQVLFGIRRFTLTLIRPSLLVVVVRRVLSPQEAVSQVQQLLSALFTRLSVVASAVGKTDQEAVQVAQVVVLVTLA